MHAGFLENYKNKKDGFEILVFPLKSDRNKFSVDSNHKNVIFLLFLIQKLAKLQYTAP